MLEWPRIVLLLVALLLLPASASADSDCASSGWNDEQLTALSGDSGLGGTGASGDETGLGGTGLAGDDSGMGGTGARGDDSGLGGTGIFGSITSLGSICVNGERVQFSDKVELVFENTVAIGAEGLAVGQTVWLVAQPVDTALFTEQIWVLPEQAGPQASATWLRERVENAGTLVRLSLEGRVERWLNPKRFAVHGVVVDAAATRDVRDVLDSAARVRVSGAVTRDGIIRADRLSVRPEPPIRRPVRPKSPAPPPRIERPRSLDRPDSTLRAIPRDMRPAPSKP
ncbi:MAG: hypothetical protein VX466_00190 [Myxococcota bacterium]|nr:hypothetical protein [Myxococcota bacterium]